MTDWQERVINEKDELDAKLLKLRAFIGGPTFTGLCREDQYLLTKQVGIMSEYFTLLALRIERFTP